VVALALIPQAPCSGACFPRSRHYSTVLSSLKRYEMRYEDEMLLPELLYDVGGENVP
jgi:hypothetical protein